MEEKDCSGEEFIVFRFFGSTYRELETTLKADVNHDAYEVKLNNFIFWLFNSINKVTR